MQKVMQAYFNTTATTTSPGDVVIMLYDGAISFLERAKQKIIEKDYAQKGILISKAMDVIGELDGSLNIEKGGNLAENLHSLYFFCNTHLLQANLKMDTEKIDKVIAILTDLRDAFATIVHTPEAVQAAQTNAMTQRAAAPQSRGTIANTSATSTIGNARASSLYAKNSQAFPASNPAPTTSALSDDVLAPHPAQELSPTRQSSPAQSSPTQSLPKQQGPVETETAQSVLTNPLEKTAVPAPSSYANSPAGSPLQANSQASQPEKPDSLEATAPSADIPRPEALTPPSRLESRFQGAALYKKFAQN